MDELDARTDEDTEHLAAQLHNQLRDLNHSILEPHGLTRPETAYTVLGNLALTSYGLAQTAEQLDAFLDRELSAGRLGHDRGDGLVPIIVQAHDALGRAHEQAAELGESFRRAVGALTSVHSTVDDKAASLEKAEEIDATVIDQAGQAASDVETAKNDFPVPIGEVLSGQDKAEPLPARRPSASPAPQPRREP